MPPVIFIWLPDLFPDAHVTLQPKPFEAKTMRVLARKLYDGVSGTIMLPDARGRATEIELPSPDELLSLLRDSIDAQVKLYGPILIP